MPPKSKNTVIRRSTPQARAAGEPLFYHYFERNGEQQKRLVTASQVREEELEQHVIPASPGQGSMTATSGRTGWLYEHDETDAQIDAIEELIAQVRSESGASLENNGVGPNGECLRGATFSWNSSTNDGEGDILISTMYTEPGPGDVHHRGVHLPSTVWVSESWVIHPDGKVEAA